MAFRPRFIISYGFATVVCCTVAAVGGYMIAYTSIGVQDELQADLALAEEAQTPTVSDRLLALLPLTPAVEQDGPIVSAVIENHLDARPQKGLHEAVLVFEMFAAGDITRFLALYHADHLPKIIDPLRSFRPHHISLLRPYHPLALHIGGSALAYDMLSKSPTIISHDGIRYDGETYERSPLKTPPHNLRIVKDKLEPVLEKHRPTLREFPFPLFETGPKSAKAEDALEIHVDLGSPEHNIDYLYLSWSKTYERNVEGAQRQGLPSNVLFLETEVDGFNQPGYIPWTRTFGEGKMLLFRNGTLERGTWKREKEGMLQFFSEDGKPLIVSKGQSWITFVPTLNMVSWE